jgi:predicted lipid-binding transport protein (Tim44 family)
MAGSVQPRAEELNHESANELMLGGGVSAPKAKQRLAGSIAMGLAIGALAGVLVGGLIGVHESSAGSIQVAGTSVIEPATP